MTDIAALEKRIARLEARNEIAELASAYAIACDEHDLERLESLFTEDAVYESPNGYLRATGRQAIMSMFTEVFKSRGPGYHWTHDIFVSVDADDPDRASGTVLSHAETTPDGVVSLAAMRYRDRYRRMDGRWRFERREISFLYYVPVESYAQGLNNADRVNVGGRRVAADYPEKLACWQEFERRHGNG